MHNSPTATDHRGAHPRQRLWQAAFLVAAVTASLALCGWAAFGAQGIKVAPHMLLGVPAYVYPGDPELAALQGLSPPPGIVILNPGNGDAAFGPSWQAQARRLRAQGITVLGYVHSDGASRSLADVETSIRNYLRPATGSDQVSGIFLDEMSSGCAAEPYYAQLYAYIRGLQRGAFVADNPGAPVNACFLQPGHRVASTFVTFEHDAGTYRTSFQGNVQNANGTFSAGRQYPAGLFWHLIYDAPGSQLGGLVSLARSRHAGYVYITDGSLPNPWDHAASYAQAEARAAATAAPLRKR